MPTTSKEFSDIRTLMQSITNPIGIDISHHQPLVDWGKVKDFGIKWAYIKSTEGAYHKDAMFLPHWQGAKSVGIPVSAYHYAILYWNGKVTSPEKEAKNLLSTVPVNYDLPLGLDLEPHEVELIVKNAGVDSAIDWIERYIAVIVDETGYMPALYTHPFIMGKQLLDKSANIFKIYKTWWARYVTNLNTLVNKDLTLPNGWGWNFWQFTSNGIVSGVSGRVDVNMFNGSPEQFDMFLKTWKISEAI